METSYQAFSNIELDLLEQLSQAVSHTTYATLFIIEHRTHSFYVVKGHPLLLCGHTEEEVREMGLSFFVEHIMPEDRQILETFKQAMHNYMCAVSKEERRKGCYIFSCFFHLLVGGKAKLPVQCEMIPMAFDDNGDYRLVYCKLSLAPKNAQKEDGLSVKNTMSNKVWTYSMVRQRWEEQASVQLSKLEHSILMLASLGHTVEEIADATHKSLSVIKHSKQRLFDKLCVKNITEAICIVLTHHLL
ncbi:MAG: LuxR C-terminal-related transcriptional regulator [Mediterranea sp.]|jgi:DNA-binding CsgD family transcriptional regulator|nr:LuxR C-terminal-related transcriptional regulator [Mediterranea sp.]